MECIKLYEAENLTNNEGFKAFYEHTEGLDLIQSYEYNTKTYAEYSSGNDSKIVVRAFYNTNDFNLKYILIEEVTQ